MYHNHAGPNQNCYINVNKMDIILAFHRWVFFPVKDAGAEYDTPSTTVFDCNWVDSIMYEYFMEDPKETYESTKVLVTIISFIEKNWYEVRSHMVQLLATHIGEAYIPL